MPMHCCRHVRHMARFATIPTDLHTHLIAPLSFAHCCDWSCTDLPHNCTLTYIQYCRVRVASPFFPPPYYSAPSRFMRRTKYCLMYCVFAALHLVPTEHAFAPQVCQCLQHIQAQHCARTIKAGRCMLPVLVWSRSRRTPTSPLSPLLYAGAPAIRLPCSPPAPA
jgi:hypothetical protein